MAQPKSLEEQVRANLPKLDARPEFAGNRLWLTFYLGGPPENLERLSVALRESGWTNLDGWEGGFLYPKVQVGKLVSEIVEAAEAMQRLCAQLATNIDLIDADTSPTWSS
jgi:hypothetical protein